MDNDINCLFEFVRDTPAEALTGHAAPYTGSVEFVAPRGMRGWLGKRMGILTHYFAPAEGYYTKEWLDAVVARAREVSPIPDRFNGSLERHLQDMNISTTPEKKLLTYKILNINQ